MSRNDPNPLVYFLVALTAIGGSVWLYIFLFVTPVYEGQMYVTGRSWQRTISYIERYEDCNWEDEDDDGDSEYVCEDRTRTKDSRSSQGSGWTGLEGRPRWPEVPPWPIDSDHYLSYYQIYHIYLHSNDRESNHVYNTGNEEDYNRFERESVWKVKLNRMDGVVGIEK